MQNPTKISDRQRASIVRHLTASGYRDYPQCYISVDDALKELYVWETESCRQPRAVLPFRACRIVW